jgi:S-(hydroxymethyl)glutathione dehydrogenase/alcohol dehydrogenase
MGKSHVDIIEPSMEKIEQAWNMGFTNVFQSIESASANYDLVLEASGTSRAIEQGFDQLSSRGTLVFASHPAHGEKVSLDPHALIKGKKIYGTWGGDLSPDTDMMAIARYILSSGVNLELLLGEVFSINEVNQGLAYLDSGRIGRPLLKLNEV